MQYNISQDIINNTTKCNRNRECLDGKNCYCEVERIINDQVAIVNRLRASECNYQTHFGSIILCSCPVRIELSRKYGV
jgi:hypothetical protein